jgi:hypothetical protein
MNKDLYTTLRSKTNFTINEIHLIVNKYRNIVSNLDISYNNIEDIFSRGFGMVVQRNLPVMFSRLDNYYNIISILDNKGVVLKYITNNHTTQE